MHQQLLMELRHPRFQAELEHIQRGYARLHLQAAAYRHDHLVIALAFKNFSFLASIPVNLCQYFIMLATSFKEIVQRLYNTKAIAYYRVARDTLMHTLKAFANGHSM